MEFKSSKELAGYLNVSESCVSRWLSKGLPVEVTGGLSYNYVLEAVIEWLKQRSPRHKRWVEQFQERLNEVD